MNTKHLLLVLLLVVASLSRLLPHAPNFTAVGAMALLAGSLLGARQGMLLSVVVLFLTDLALGFHSTMVFVYAGMALVALMGSYVQKPSSQKIKFFGFIGAGSLSFFLITNFGVWLVDGFYPMTFEGLLTSYTMGLPFLKNQLMGDVFFSLVLFVVAGVLQLPVLRRAKA